jgi:GNAT superfamily N-acetyltransferase
MSTTITPAIAGQAGDLGALIAEAFHPLAVSRWLAPEPTHRRRAQTGQFTMLVHHALAYGEVHTTADLDAVAVWLPHDGARAVPPVTGYHQRLAQICGPFLARFTALDAALHASQPAFAHWYLALLAVRPERQGHSLGSALLDFQHRALDRLGMPSFLQTGDIRSSRLYARHGYTPLGDPFPAGPGGPPMYSMWRPPGVVPTGRWTG